MGVNNLSYSGNGLNLTKGFEKRRYRAYDDARPDYELELGDKVLGTLTIGDGHTGRDVYIGQTCTDEEADAWLLQDTMRAQICVNTYVDVVLTQDEFDALVDFVFNVGCAAFKGSTLLKVLNQNDMPGAAKHLEDWEYSKGVKLAGLIRRRLAEEALFEQHDA